MINFHVSINSIYLQIVRVRHTEKDYIKAHVRFYSKGSNVLLQEIRSLKIMKKTMRHWEQYNDA